MPIPFRIALCASDLRTALCAFLTGLGLWAATAPAAQAWPEENRSLGFGHFLNNDVLGDGKDRWQSGSYTLSWVRGTEWSGHLPSRPFEIVEYRLGGAIVAPSRLVNPPAGDRRYVAKSLFSLHSQFAPRPGLEADLGLGFVWTGPSNGLSGLQDWIHNTFSMPEPTADDTQWPNHLYPVISAELARPVALGGGGAELRPFVAAQAGDESLVRFGADLAFGLRETGALWLRDDITGHRYVGVSGQSAPGTAFVLGGDVAHVFDSVYFPASGGVAAETTRTRLRAGVSTRLGEVGVFYGLTWLSREFEGQPEGQVLGSARLRMNF